MDKIKEYKGLKLKRIESKTDDCKGCFFNEGFVCGLNGKQEEENFQCSDILKLKTYIWVKADR